MAGALTNLATALYILASALTLLTLALTILVSALTILALALTLLASALILLPSAFNYNKKYNSCMRGAQTKKEAEINQPLFNYKIYLKAYAKETLLKPTTSTSPYDFT
tara:strand:+ start:195 stop:518 length:324 start_codon:yes stop_codon:yes gene_type:complete